MARAAAMQGFLPAPLPVVEPERRTTRTIEGALGDTPLPSLLLQLATRAATGTLVFRGDFGERRIYFVDGVVARVAPGGKVPSAASIVALLDAEASSSSEVILDAVAHAQIVAALEEVSSFAPETTFDFRMATDALTGADVPARGKACDLLESIMVATRCARDEARLEEGLLRVVGKPVSLRANVDVDRFAPNAQERRVLDVIARDKPTYEALCAHDCAPIGVIRRTVHALLYTRHLDLGVSAPPLGGDKRVRDAIVARRDAIVSVLSAPETASNEEVAALVGDVGEIDPSMLPAALDVLKSAAEKAFSRVSEARRALAAVREMGVQRAFDAMEHHRLAELAARDGNFREAEAQATLAVEKDATAPEYAATLEWIRAMQSNGEMLTAAIAKTSELLEASTPSDWLLVRRAALLRRAGREGEALSDYRTALELNPANVDAARALAPRRRADAPNALTRIPTPPPMMRTAAASNDAPKSGTRRGFWIAAVIAFVGIGATIGFSQMRTPQAKAREEIVAWGIAEEMRDENSTTTTQEMTLDAEPDADMRAVVALLEIDEKLDDGKGSHSDATVQQTANRYLLRRAEHHGFVPPAEAVSLARDVDHKANIAPARWSALVPVWNRWLDAPTAAPSNSAP